MNWRLKALCQNLVARLPQKLSYRCYYLLQRKFGALQTSDPRKHLAAGVLMVDRIGRHGGVVRDKTFLEVGTGRTLNVPLVLWLCGASEIITVDVNPYLKEELVLENLSYIKHHQSQVLQLFGRHREKSLFQRRFAKLLHARSDVHRLRRLMNLRYIAPGDAACLDLPSASVDYHVSLNVFEHVPPSDLERILAEAKRVLGCGGLLVHRVDFSDHFSHGDRSISAINFLRFSDRQWAGYAGNRYMYHNRMRVSDFVRLFAAVATDVTVMDPTVDARSLALLRRGFAVDESFRQYDEQAAATIDAWMVAAVGAPEQSEQAAGPALKMSA